MKTMSAMTVSSDFRGLLDEVRQKSEKIVFEQDGQLVAILTPFDAEAKRWSDREVRLAALDRLCGISKTTSRGRSVDRWLEKERAEWKDRD